ncbi:MAG: hypothetical protein ACLUYS_03585 [Allobaculum sp.]|uniref:hypothetical protein n=1 Tax=Allobaculum sp. TaxID=1872463 RepID=UPI0039996157
MKTVNAAAEGLVWPFLLPLRFPFIRFFVFNERQDKEKTKFGSAKSELWLDWLLFEVPVILMQ